MKRIIVIVLLLIVSVPLFAQNTGKGITIIEDPRIEHYLKEYNRIAAIESKPQYVYRIQLIATYERSEATGTQARFRRLFPEEPSFLQHNGVQFLVRGGEFTNRADAEVKLRDIRREFPSAFLLPRQRVKQN